MQNLGRLRDEGDFEKGELHPRGPVEVAPVHDSERSL